MWRRFVLTSLCLGVLLIATAAQAAEFSADVIQTVNGQTLRGKIYVSEGMIRNERAVTPDVRHLALLDRHSQEVTMLVPAAPGAPDLGDTAYLTTLDAPAWQADAEKTTLGAEVLQGYECDKIRYVFKDKVFPDRDLGSSTQWVARKLNYPIRTELVRPSGTITTELSNIQEGPQPANLFVAPAQWYERAPHAPDPDTTPRRR